VIKISLGAQGVSEIFETSFFVQGDVVDQLARSQLQNVGRRSWRQANVKDCRTVSLLTLSSSR